MSRCTPIPKPLCHPTPFVGYASDARWVSLKYCQAVDLTSQISNDLQSVLMNHYKPVDSFPLQPAQCLNIIEQIREQLPEACPEKCCTEFSFRLKESDIYLIKKWLCWMDTYLAELIEPIDATTAGGVVAIGKIKRLYEKLTDVRRRLSPPLTGLKPG